MQTEPFPVLSAMINVMAQVVEAERPLEMSVYFQTNEGPTHVPRKDWTIHNCGTAACVAGYACVDPTVKAIAGLEEDEANPIGVWNELEYEIGSHLAASICTYAARQREKWATLANNENSLDLNLDHTHLTSDGTTAADALDYMKHMLKALESRHAS